jgi:hypothetical protein
MALVVNFLQSAELKFLHSLNYGAIFSVVMILNRKYMKQQINIRITHSLFAGLFLFLLSACSPGNKVGSGGTPEEIVSAISNDNWIFTASNSNPQNGRARAGLTGINEAKYTKDSLVVYLPYIGRLYSGAEALNTRGPLDFISTDMEVTKEKKNDGWAVTIKPKDHNPVQLMYFNLYENGTAQLNVTFTNRSPISFNGSIRNATGN